MNQNRDTTISLLASFGLGYLITGYRHFRLHRKVKDMPTSSIGSAPQGLVEVHGHAHALKGQMVQDCLGMPCVFVEFEILARSRNGWRVVGEERLGGRFILEDETGSVHVVVTGAELHLKDEILHWSQVPIEIRQRIQQSQDKNLRWPLTESWFMPPRFRKDAKLQIRERKLIPGNPVYALGVLRSRTHEPEAEVIGSDGSLRKVSPIGGLMNHPLHSLVLSDTHEEDLLKRIKGGTLKMVFGAILLSLASAVAML